MRQFLLNSSSWFAVKRDHWATFLDLHLHCGWKSADADADPRPLGLPLQGDNLETSSPTSTLQLCVQGQKKRLLHFPSLPFPSFRVPASGIWSMSAPALITIQVMIHFPSFPLKPRFAFNCSFLVKEKERRGAWFTQSSKPPVWMRKWNWGVMIIGENWHLFADEPVKFEKQPVEFQDCKENYRSFLRNL